jgi:hypothetical protein
MTTKTPYRRRRRWTRLVSTTPACGVCLDFGHLNDLGPCPWCEPDAENAHYLALAEAQLIAAETEDVA